MQYKQAAILLMSSSVWLSPAHVTADSDYGTAGDAVKNVCTEAAYFKASSQAATEALQQRIRDIETRRRQSIFWRLAAANTPTGKFQRQLQALAIFADKTAQDAEQALAGAATAVSDYIAIASTWTGALVTAEQAANLEHKSTGKHTKAGSGASATVKLTQHKNTDVCTETELKDAQGKPVSVTLTGMKKLKISTAAAANLEGHSHTLTLKACNADTQKPASCNQNNVFGAAATTNDVIMLHASAGSKSFIISTSTPTARAYTGSTGTDIGATTETSQTCRSSHTYSKAFIPSATDIAHALCKATDALQAATPTAISNSVAELANSKDFMEIVNNLRAVSDNRYDLEKADELAKLQQLIKTAYGEQENAFESKYKTNVGKEIIIYGTGSNPKKGSIADLASKPEAALALSFLEGKNLMQKLCQNEGLVAKKAELDCTDKGKDDCTSEKCEFKEGKCVAKEEVKSENDGKRTNTTGSNSFVISKVPLMLAFFIIA
uniref:Variant surface glycoprotein 1125.290 n=1 Tax=Trypanosoma brucei TaxID=5691 RepID=A0A1J0R496_9TRYP|nr:variant surface glycoprotein 1125.290 [Trypanosoma brucei]